MEEIEVIKSSLVAIEQRCVTIVSFCQKFGDSQPKQHEKYKIILEVLIEEHKELRKRLLQLGVDHPELRSINSLFLKRP